MEDYDSATTPTSLRHHQDPVHLLSVYSEMSWTIHVLYDLGPQAATIYDRQDRHELRFRDTIAAADAPAKEVASAIEPTPTVPPQLFSRAGKQSIVKLRR